MGVVGVVVVGVGVVVVVVVAGVVVLLLLLVEIPVTSSRHSSLKIHPTPNTPLSPPPTNEHSTRYGVAPNNHKENHIQKLSKKR